MDNDADRRVALEAALAGTEAMADASGDLRQGRGTETKENVNDLVTRYDRQSQDAIVATLRDARPEDRIVGEEDGDSLAREPTGGGREWIVDPIDGTANFAVGFPYFCVSIALQVDGERTVGVVASPAGALDRCWYGVRGDGAFLVDGLDSLDPADPGGNRLSVTDQAELSGAFTFGRLSERNAERREIDNRIVTRLLAAGSKYRRVGSAALNLAHVAAGAADAYVVLSLQPWDIAAGLLLVEEAGGDVRTQPARIEEGSIEVVASNGGLQTDLEAIVDSEL